MKLPVNLKDKSYDIIIENGALDKIDEYLNLNRKVLVCTDSLVPSEYSKKILDKCKNGYLYCFKSGEASKNFDVFKGILEELVKNGFTRSDCVVACGGGVTGDMAGFAASTFMRGIEFYNVPTTLLSQVDSSIGGKTAIDFCGVKNIVGSFYQPSCVVIDPNTLSTLDDRLFNEGLVEAIKMALTFDKDLFEFIESCDDIRGNINYIIEGALKLKRWVVENDPKEKGLRKVLNFGHTIGHAIEASSNNLYYHGECVGMGMLYLSSEEVRERIYKLLLKLNLPVKHSVSDEEIIGLVMHDKKKSGNTITVIEVLDIGSYEMKELTIEELKKILERSPLNEK